MRWLHVDVATKTKDDIYAYKTLNKKQLFINSFKRNRINNNTKKSNIVLNVCLHTVTSTNFSHQNYIYILMYKYDYISIRYTLKKRKKNEIHKQISVCWKSRAVWWNTRAIHRTTVQPQIYNDFTYKQKCLQYYHYVMTDFIISFFWFGTNAMHPMQLYLKNYFNDIMNCIWLTPICISADVRNLYFSFDYLQICAWLSLE